MSPLNRPVWKILHLATGGVFLWFAAQFLFSLYGYLPFSKEIPIEVEQWRFHKIEEEKCVIEAVYSYTFRLTEYSGCYRFKIKEFLTEERAQEMIEKFRVIDWKAWINPHFPSHSTLQRFFPFKVGIQSILSLGVFVYFFWLKRYSFQAAR